MTNPEAATGVSEKEERRGPRLDLRKVDKSRRLAKQNKDYLYLVSVLEKARKGLAVEGANLKSKPAKEAARQLLRQLELISNMTLLPYVILMMMEGRIEGARQSLREVFEFVLKRKGEKRSDREVFEEQSRRAMKYFFALDEGGSLSRPWLFAITVYTWTAFEGLAGDLWVNSLNQTPALAHRTINSISSEDEEKSGLSRRHIEMGLAARYGFDLRRHLGTLLKSKFDFGKLKGVQEAYAQAFGASGLDESACKGLKELEQVRHLIVHRGGIADERFLRTTKLRARRGAPLSLKLSQVCDYMMTVTLGCVALLKTVDGWFASNE